MKQSKGLKLVHCTVAAGMLMLYGAAANATVILLDLTSGTDSVENGATFAFDTYREDGFLLQMDRSGDHIDRGFLGDLGFHNGPANGPNVSWTLSFGGNVFSLLGVDIGDFSNGGSSVTITGSNGAARSVSAIGSNAILGLTNITSATFDIDQDSPGSVESVGLKGIRVDNARTVTKVPEPGTLALIATGLACVTFVRRKKKAT